jgi:hypothetical protein
VDVLIHLKLAMYLINQNEFGTQIHLELIKLLKDLFLSAFTFGTMLQSLNIKAEENNKDLAADVQEKAKLD